MQQNSYQDVQRLWLSVLISAVNDLISVNDSRHNPRRDVERWIGDFPSADFIEVCRQANLDHNLAHVWFRTIARLPVQDRKQAVAHLKTNRGRFVPSLTNIAA